MKNRLDRVNESIKRELGLLVRREFTFQAKLVTVKGKVLLKDGTPVKNGTVTFHPDTSKGNQSKAARILGMHRSTLIEKLKLYGLG